MKSLTRGGFGFVDIKVNDKGLEITINLITYFTTEVGVEIIEYAL